MMHRTASRLLGLGCALVLTLVCFHAVLFGGHQFAYRDAGHFYYPLYRVVQQEWKAGRWPLWNPWQNSGTPLLGMPMAAVFYPGKLLYALLPYDLAARLYIVVHTLLAWLGMLALARTLRLSRTGAFLAAMSYAFGAPILFLYSNVIFLVGASWAPWGFRALHRLLAAGNRWGMLELGFVLAHASPRGRSRSRLPDCRRGSSLRRRSLLQRGTHLSIGARAVAERCSGLLCWQRSPGSLPGAGPPSSRWENGFPQVLSAG